MFHQEQWPGKERILVSFIEKCDMKFGRFGWTFMQDGAPCHTSSSTLQRLQNKVAMVPGWPPNSPDLNPIEIIWGIIKKKLKKKIWGKREDIFHVLLEVWNSIDQRVINSLVSDFIRRCRIVLDLSGNRASQYISSHRKEVQSKDKALNEHKPWSDDDDNRLLMLQSELGCKWKNIGILLGRTNVETRNRFNFLDQMRRNKVLRDKQEFPGIDSLDALLDDNMRNIFLGML